MKMKANFCCFFGGCVLNLLVLESKISSINSANFGGS